MHAGGRPSLYDPKYCDDVLTFGAEGKSLAWMAAEFGVSKPTMYAWQEEHPEFLYAMTRARALAQRWWEDIGQNHIVMHKDDGVFNASAWSRSMAARFPDDWREKTEATIQGPDGKAVVIERIIRTVTKP